MKKKTISILLPNLGGGGAEKAYLELAREFVLKEYSVEFALMQFHGELLEKAETKFSIVNLNCHRFISLPKILINYLRISKPDILITSMWPLTVIAPLSKLLSRHRCKVLVCEQNYLSVQYQNKSLLNWVLMRISMALGYRIANARIGVSNGVINDISKLSGLPTNKFELIYNPIPSYIKPSEGSLKYAEELWACPKGARIITVGKFKAQKNHKLLLKALAKIHHHNARLMFVGDGEGRKSLSLLAENLKIQDKVIFAGFQIDTTPFYETADLFVLSSDYEGFGNVIVEALSCGTPVVSTNCPSGPAEILDNGRYGSLVPVNDEKALAKAIDFQLDKRVDKDLLINRALDFSTNLATNKYLKSIEEII